MYDPDDGPGCGHKEHEPACLCDVDLELLKLPLPPKRSDRDAWEYEYEVLYGDERKARLQAPIVREARALWTDLRCSSPRSNRPAKAVRVLLSRGYELDEVAQAFGVTERAVLQAIMRNADHVTIEQMHWVMDELRGTRDRHSIARDVGLRGEQLQRLARAMGLPDRGRSHLAQHDEKTYRAALRLREEGKSWTQVANELGLASKAAAVGLVRHSARFAEVSV